MTNPSTSKFETRAIILAATLLCEHCGAQDPRTSRLGSHVELQKIRSLTLKESTKILEDHGIGHYGG